MLNRRLFDRLIHAGDSVLDIGAHEGDMARYFAGLVGEDGKVFAFEPNSSKYQNLKANVAGSRNVHCEALAVTSHEGKVPFYYGMADFADMASTIVADLATEQRLGSEIRRVDVDCTTVDAYCRRHGIRPVFMKIDVEGAEPSVLEGATETIRTQQPLIYLETSIDLEIPLTLKRLRDAGYLVAVSDMFKFLRREEMVWEPGKYLTSDVPALENVLLTFEDDEILENAPILANVIAIPRGRVDEIWNVLERMRLRDGLKLMKPHALPYDIRMKLLAKRLLPRAVFAPLRRLYHSLRRRSG